MHSVDSDLFLFPFFKNLFLYFDYDFSLSLFLCCLNVLLQMEQQFIMKFIMPKTQRTYILTS